MLSSLAFVHIIETSKPALQPGQVIRIIWVNRVTFCPGKPGLTNFIKYLGGSRVLIMTSHDDDVLDNVSISC